VLGCTGTDEVKKKKVKRKIQDFALTDVQPSTAMDNDAKKIKEW
jgi:hypothetical protein